MSTFRLVTEGAVVYKGAWAEGGGRGVAMGADTTEVDYDHLAWTGPTSNGVTSLVFGSSRPVAAAVAVASA